MSRTDEIGQSSEELASPEHPSEEAPREPLLVWNNRCSLSDGALNREHKELFDALNAVQDAVLNDEGRSEIGAHLIRLALATHKHFISEQARMASARYPGLPLHTLKHEQLLEELDRFIVRYDYEGMILDDHSLNFLRDWLLDHLQTMDLSYAVWLKEAAQAKEHRG